MYHIIPQQEGENQSKKKRDNVFWKKKKESASLSKSRWKWIRRMLTRPNK